MSHRQNEKLVVAVILVAIISVGATYAVLTSGTLGKTVTTSVSTSTPSLTTGGTLIIEEACCIDTLDPAGTGTTQGAEVDNNVYQSLVAYNGNSTQIVPLLAQGYNVSADGLTYTFMVRQNITFSNGDPLNAYVLWYSMYRSAIMNQFNGYLVTVALNTKSVTASMLNQYTTTTPPASLIQIMQDPSNAIVVPNAYELIFHLSHPFAAFLAALTQPGGGTAVDPVVVSANGGVVAGKPNTWMNLNAMGTGPFVLTQYQPNTQLTLTKNPTYWGGVGNIQPTPKVDQVIIRSVPDALTRMEDIQRGSAQISFVNPSLVAESVSGGQIYVPKIGPVMSTYIISLDTLKFPFSNKLIRQAVVHAIDYSAILQLFYGFAIPFVGPVPVGVLGHSDLPQYSYNVTLARQLLAQAGYPNGTGIPPVMLVGSVNPPQPDILAIVQSNLADIGINVQVRTQSYATSMNQLYGNKPTSSAYPDMFSQAWLYFADPWAFANWFLGDLDYCGVGNAACYNSTAVNNLLTQANAAVDPSQRATIYQQIAQIVYDDAPYVWIAQSKNAFNTGVPIVSTNVQGFVPNLGFAELDLSHLYLVSQAP